MDEVVKRSSDSSQQMRWWREVVTAHNGWCGEEEGEDRRGGEGEWWQLTMYKVVQRRGVWQLTMDEMMKRRVRTAYRWWRRG